MLINGSVFNGARIFNARGLLSLPLFFTVCIFAGSANSVLSVSHFVRPEDNANQVFVEVQAKDQRLDHAIVRFSSDKWQTYKDKKLVYNNPTNGWFALLGVFSDDAVVQYAIMTIDYLNGLEREVE